MSKKLPCHLFCGGVWIQNIFVSDVGVVYVFGPHRGSHSHISRKITQSAYFFKSLSTTLWWNGVVSFASALPGRYIWYSCRQPSLPCRRTVGHPASTCSSPWGSSFSRGPPSWRCSPPSDVQQVQKGLNLSQSCEYNSFLSFIKVGTCSYAKQWIIIEHK